jgi:ribosomal protein S18 acetylase RimI-like enzyme
VSGGPRDPTVPRSLVYATDLDVLAADHVVERRDGYLVVRSPGNPTFYWGNLLLFDEPPRPGDGPRWEATFDREFAGEPRVRHRTFAWDTTDGQVGAALDELVARGYLLEESVGLVADAGGLGSHPRENPEVAIRALDPDADEEAWEGVLALQLANRDPSLAKDAYLAFCRARQSELRTLLRAGHGAWYVALAPGDAEVVGACGIVVTGGRGRFQSVDTALAHRRRGICSRLVVEASRLSEADFGTERFVIVAEPGYHALGLYESLGFERRERAAGAYLRPPGN